MNPLQGWPRHRVAFVGFALLLSIAAEVLAYSNNPGALIGRTNRPGDAGSGCAGCHGANPDPQFVLAIAGPTALNPGQSATYTATATKSGVANGLRMGLAVAASDAGTPLAVFAGEPMSAAGSGEIIHNANVGALKTTAANSASYQFTYTMPAGAAAGSTHTIHAVSVFAFAAWNHAQAFTVTTRPAAPATLTPSNILTTSINFAWTGGGPEYRLVYKAGAVAPANETDGTQAFQGAGTSHTVTGLSASTQYTFRVFSKLSGSSVFSSTGPSQTVTTAAIVQATRYVNAATGVNTGNCTNAGTPCKTITYAMAQATAGNPGDMIQVAPGTYNLALGEVFPIAFKSGIELVATGTPANTIIDGAGDTVREGLIHVTNNTSATARLQGFTLMNGLNLPDFGGVALGGAVFVNAGSGTFTITRNFFTGNEARGYSGISELNQTGGLAWGGAIMVFATTVNITNNVFEGNVARGGNGFSHPSTPLSNNETGGPAVGGAIYFAGSGKITNNTFDGNGAVGGNGCGSSTGFGLGGSGHGGAVSADGDPAPSIVNNIFTHNGATSGSGGTQEASSAGAVSSSNAPSISNNLFFGNTVNGAPSADDSTGTNAVTQDPQYHNAPFNYRIPLASPANGAGTPTGAPAVDYDGVARPNPPSIGAFEASATLLLQLVPASVNFGGQSMGTTSPTMSVTVTNIGSGTVTINGVQVSNTQFAQINDCTSLAPGVACTVDLAFTPAPTGGALNSTAAVNGTLTITSNATGSPHTATLAGTAEKSLARHYYRAILNRAPEPGGKEFWESEAARLAALGVNVNEVWFLMANYFFNSAEYIAAGKSNTDFLIDVYNTFFNRPPDQGGFDFWMSQIAAGLSREGVIFWFMFSNEFRTFTEAIFGNTAARPEVDMVMDLFRGILNRPPDTAALNAFVGQLRSAQCQGVNAPGAVYTAVNDISYFFLFGSAEYANRGRSNTQFVSDMYNAFLRRGGAVDEVNFWINQLNTGARDRNTERADFIASPEFGTRVNNVINAGCLP